MTEPPTPAPAPRVALAVLSALGALVVAVAPFVPSILWYTGDTLFDSASTQLSFASATWMELRHEHELHHGMLLFLLPSLFAALALGLRSQVGWKKLWPRLALVSVGIAALELFLIEVEADYGTLYDDAAGFLGIQSMIPSDRFLAHALAILLGSITWALGEQLRARDAVHEDQGQRSASRQ